MEKYRVRLKSGRVVGPFIAEQILEMREKGHVVGEEECQLFPAGDWLPIKSYAFWGEQARPLSAGEGTFVVDLTAQRAALRGDLPPAEKTAATPLPSHDEDGVVLEDLEEEPLAPAAPPSKEDFREFDYRRALLNKTRTGVSKADLEKIKEEVATRSRAPVEADAKTVIRPSVSRPVASEEVEHTVVSPSAKQWRAQIEEEKRKEAAAEERRMAILQQKAQEAEANKVDYNNDATQAISLNEIRGKVSQEAKRAETELVQIEEQAEEQRRAEEEAELAEIRQAEAKKIAEEKAVDRQANRKRFVLLAVLVLVMLAVLFPEDEAPKKKMTQIVPVDPEINFPVPFDVKDKLKADKLYAAGVEKLAKGDYPSRITAAKAFRQSYENDTDKKEALGKMIRLYGELLPHSSGFRMDGNTVFKLLQSHRLLADVEPDVALGAGLFYRAIDKKEASLDVMDRFVKSQANKPTRELFGAYLVALSDRNIETRADEVAASLLKTEKRGVDVNLALVHYFRYKNYTEKAREVLNQALKEVPDSVPLIISRGEFQLEANDLKGLVATVKKIREEGAESSRLYYGKLLEFEGFILAFQNKVDEAAKKFDEALKYTDSEGLRDRLTNLSIDPAAGGEAARLIKQVKARELSKEARVAMEKFDYQTALLKSLEAHGLGSGYIKADLSLAAIQMRLGMTKEAIETLEALHKTHGEDPEVGFALLKAYIDNYKLTDAKRMFTIMAVSEMREDWRYSSLNSEMYERLGDLNQSILWLQKAINQNPLEDQNLFKLSQLFMRAKKFPQAKNNLFKAMELNPMHIEYKIAYAGIIYEIDGVDKAIDYLFGLLKQFPDNPSVLGEIAIYYHRAGKNKQFLDTKKDIEELPVRDPRVYKFLIRASLLDEKYDDAVKFTDEYIKLEPGDLAAMMDIGKALMKLKRYREAAGWFVRVRDRLPFYPKVGYFKAKIELYLVNPDQALIDVREDMKVNGEYEDGLNLVGDILFQKGEYIPAENEYKKSLRINARSYGAMRGLADVAFKRGQMDISLDLYKRAVVETAGVADDPGIHRKLGDVYRLMGQGSLAIESYQVYLKLVPDAPERAELEQHIRVME